MSRRTEKAIDELDEKLRWGLITAQQYDRAYARVMATHTKPQGQRTKKTKRKKRIILTSADTLQSAMGKVAKEPSFSKAHMSFRSARIRGVTARLAKQSDSAMVRTIDEEERLAKKRSSLKRKKVL
jgi:hypothetical protein